MAVERIIGIDFGTSTSLIKVKTYKDGQSINDKVLADYIEFNNNATVPSLIFETLDGQYYCGYEAEHAAVKGTTHRNFKLDLLSPDTSKRELAEKMISTFLKHLYNRYDFQKTHFPECDIETTYISYPAKWPQNMRDFMKNAAAQAGFRNVQGLDEPSAAIHTVVVQESGRLQQRNLINEQGTNILMIDMGAGTTDLAICRYQPGEKKQVEILCTWPKDMSHSLFGGREIDEALSTYVKQYLINSGMANVKNFEQRYMSQCKSWKETNVSPLLNKNNDVKYCAFIDPMLEMLGVENEFSPISRRKFEEMNYEYLRQFPQMVNDCVASVIENGKLSSSEDIDLIILTGGHSQWYFTNEMLTGEISYFGEVNLPKIQRDGSARVIRLASPQETVAYGLVYQRLSASLSKPSPTPRPIPKPTKTVINVRGNTASSIANGGYFAQQGDWVYYRNLADGLKLYKMRLDGTDKVKLSDDDCEYINVVGDWVYYKTFHGLRKTLTDGSETVTLYDNDNEYFGCHGVNVIGDTIYYSTYYGLYKMKTDGSSKIKLCSDECREFNVVGDWIYYLKNVEYQTYYSLNKIKTDGSCKTKLCDNCSDFNVTDSHIYYVDAKKGHKLYRMGLNGWIKVKLCEDSFRGINVKGDWIYYCNLSDGYKLYKIRTDGSCRTKLVDEGSFRIFSIGDDIFFSDDAAGNKYFKIRPDGTGRQPI